MKLHGNVNATLESMLPHCVSCRSESEDATQWDKSQKIASNLEFSRISENVLEYLKFNHVPIVVIAVLAILVFQLFHQIASI